MAKMWCVFLLLGALGCHARRLVKPDDCPRVYPNGATIDADGTATLNGAPVASRERCDMPRFFAAPYRGPWGTTSWYAASEVSAPTHDTNFGTNQIWAYASADFFIPQPPTQLPSERAPDGRIQALGLFPGIMTNPAASAASIHWILQPVLFYGEDPIGSGHWGWWATSIFNQGESAPQQMTELVAVPSGAGLRGIIKLEGTGDGSRRVYSVSFASTESNSVFTFANFVVTTGLGNVATPMALEVQLSPLLSCAELPATSSGGINYWNMRLGIPTIVAPPSTFGPIPTMVLGQGSDNSFAGTPINFASPNCGVRANYTIQGTSGSLTWNTQGTP